MTPRSRILITLSILLLTALACEYLPGPGTPPDGDVEDSIATSVAATLAASEGEEVGPAVSPEVEATGIPELMPTNTPEPTIMVPEVLKAAFTQDGDVYYWEEGSLPVMLTTIGDAVDVRISDDGSVIAFTRGPDYYHQELWAINSDGGNLRQLVDLATLNSYTTDPDVESVRVYSFTFKPGTHQVAYNTQLTFLGPGLFINDDLRVVDANTAILTTIMAPGSAGNFFYSPDGSKIGLVTSTQVSVVNADGSGRIDLLAFPMVITYSEYHYYPPLSWTEDGSAIRVVIPPEDPLAITPDVTRIWQLPADGSPASILMTLNTVSFPLDAVSLSANTERVAYMEEITPGSPPNLGLHLSNVDGSGDMTYATGPLKFYGWASNGVHFLYTDASPNPLIGQYGVGPTPLASVTQLIKASWVDETRFFFESKNGINFEFWLGEVGLPSILLNSGNGRVNFDFSE